MAKAGQDNASAQDQSLIQGRIVDLGVMARIIRAEALTFVTVLFLGLALSIAYLHMARLRYAVRMQVTPASSADQQKSGGLSSALTSLAGFGLGNEGTPQFRKFLGTLRSSVAAEAIANDQDLLKLIFYREWSQSDRQWRQPASSLRPALHAVGGLLGMHFATWAPPGVSRVFDYLKDQLKIIPDAKSGVVTLEIDSDRPQVAERVLLTLNDAMNERLRQHDLEHATTDIAYLTQRLAEVSVVEYRTALVTNLAEQEKSRMLASAPLPYASDVLGKPMISTEPISPKPLAAWAAGIIFGGLLGLSLANLKYNRR